MALFSNTGEEGREELGDLTFPELFNDGDPTLNTKLAGMKLVMSIFSLSSIINVIPMQGLFLFLLLPFLPLVLLLIVIENDAQHKPHVFSGVGDVIILLMGQFKAR